MGLFMPFPFGMRVIERVFWHLSVMTQITKELANSIRAEIESALSSVGLKHGLVFTTGSASFIAGEDGNI
jgi:hypothetical protein